MNLGQALGGDLVGVYLHGSLASGGFDPARSDIDILVVARRPLDEATRRRLAACVCARSGHPCPVEVSVLAAAALQTWCYPPPYEFHFGETLRRGFEEGLESTDWSPAPSRTRGDPDLAAHITHLQSDGVALAGQTVNSPRTPG
ncbi:MAG: nucleotidyltransferase domain-containing protein [Pseudomonadota bacterium]